MDSWAPKSFDEKDNENKKVEGCWNCGSPLPHRAGCTEKLPDTYAAETRREIKRLQEAVTSKAEASGPVPVGFTIPEMDSLLNKSDQFYYEMEIELNDIGRPTIQLGECKQLHTNHKKLNFKLYMYRTGADKMCSSFKKCPLSYFASADQYNLFMAKVESVRLRRAHVWELSSRLLVWSKMAVQLSTEWKRIKASLTAWMGEAKSAMMMGRPKELENMVAIQAPRKMKELDQLLLVLAELKKICRTDLIQRIDNIGKIGTMKVTECVANLNQVKDELKKKEAIQEVMSQFEQEKAKLYAEQRLLEQEKKILDNLVKS